MSSLEKCIDKPLLSDMTTENHTDNTNDSSHLIHKHENEAFLNGHREMVNSDQTPAGDTVLVTKSDENAANSLETKAATNQPQIDPSFIVTDDREHNPNEVSSKGVYSASVDASSAMDEVDASETKSDTALNGAGSPEIETGISVSETMIPASNSFDMKQSNGIEVELTEESVQDGAENPKSSENSEPSEDDWILVLGHEKLKKKKLKPGDGLSSRPRHGDIVTVSYSAYLEDGKEVDKHEQDVFTLGDGDVIQALDLCIALMELHEVCKVVTEAQYAYGAKGREPDIPPNAKLTYTVELVSVEEAPDYSMWPVHKRIEEGNKKKERGNELYSRGEYSFAINSYTKALSVLDDGNEMTHSGSAEDLQLLLDTRMICFNNLAAAQIKVEAWDAAIQSCDEVLKKQSENVKALFRKGKCLSNKGELEMAIVYLQKALKLEPSSKVIHKELVRLKAKNRIQDKSQAAMYQRMFWGGNKKTEKQKTDKSQWWLYLGGAISAAVISASLAAYRYLHT